MVSPLRAIVVVLALVFFLPAACSDLGIASIATAQSVRVVPPRAESLARDVHVLADPAMEGRASGTLGGERAAREIARQLELARVRPGGDRGTFFQSFVVATGTRIAATSRFDVFGPVGRLELNRDWQPHGG